MAITPYIHFQGNCADAMAAYQSILGGQLDMMRYSQTPEAKPPFDTSDLVMHAALMSPFGDLMASDFPPGFEGDPQKAVSVTISADDLDDCRRVFEALMQEGAVIQPFAQTFFSPGFGMGQDRFGTHWLVMANPAQP